MTLVGYGDVSPCTQPGERFASLSLFQGLISKVIIWTMFGVATVTQLVAVVTEAYANRYISALAQKGTHRAFHAIKEQRDGAIVEGIHGRDTDANGDISSLEVLTGQYPKIIDLVKTWHAHIVAARHGAIEGTDSETSQLTYKVGKGRRFDNLKRVCPYHCSDHWLATSKRYLCRFKHALNDRRSYRSFRDDSRSYTVASSHRRGVRKAGS